jgi:hopanoid-associated phosphorylase
MATSRGPVSDLGQPALLSVCGLDAEARIAALWPSEVILSGALPERLAERLARTDLRRYRLAISFGLAGGLDPTLKAGDIVIADAIRTPDSHWTTAANMTRRLAAAIPGAIIGGIAGVDQALIDPAAKRLCRQQTGAIAVDMESQVIARACAAVGLPCIVLRAISDAANRSLPELATVALDADGKLATSAILRSLLRAPSQILGLPRLARDSTRAFASLKRAGYLAGPVLVDLS